MVVPGGRRYEGNKGIDHSAPFSFQDTRTFNLLGDDVEKWEVMGCIGHKHEYHLTFYFKDEKSISTNTQIFRGLNERDWKYRDRLQLRANVTFK